MGVTEPLSDMHSCNLNGLVSCLNEHPGHFSVQVTTAGTHKITTAHVSQAVCE